MDSNPHPLGYAGMLATLRAVLMMLVGVRLLAGATLVGHWSDKAPGASEVGKPGL